MEANIAKLVHMVGGILIGVILLALISYFFSSIGLLPSQEDKTESREQLAKFNLEYEIYDKKGMYGVDVISCLNKAKSNNEKYAEGGSFLTGNQYGENFYVDVYVRLTKKEYLEESLEVYYIDKGVQRQFFSDPNDRNITTVKIDGNDLKMGDSTVSFFNSGFKSENCYTTFDKETKVQTISVPIKNASDLKCNEKGIIAKNQGLYSHVDFNGNPINGYYTLRDLGVGEGASKTTNKNALANLLMLSNKSDIGNLTRIATNTTGKNLDKWSRIVWKTALYDLKSRQFKCDFITYNDITGRVCEIGFSEI